MHCSKVVPSVLLSVDYKNILSLYAFTCQILSLLSSSTSKTQPKEIHKPQPRIFSNPKNKMMCRCSRCPNCTGRGLYEPIIELSLADRREAALRRATISSQPATATVRFQQTVKVRYDTYDTYEEIQKTTTRYRYRDGSLIEEDRPTYDQSTPRLPRDDSRHYSGREDSRHGPSSSSRLPPRPSGGRRETHAGEERLASSNRPSRPQTSEGGYSGKRRDVSPPRMAPQYSHAEPRTRAGPDSRASGSKHESSKFTSSKPASSRPPPSGPTSSSSRREDTRQDHRPHDTESRHSKTRNTDHRHHESESRHSKTRNTDNRTHESESRHSNTRHTRREDKTRGKTSLDPIAESTTPDYYAILGISSRASPDEIAKAARKMRIETHPDKLKTPGMSAREEKKIDERAASVGQAADVLMDSAQKRMYDKGRL